MTTETQPLVSIIVPCYNYGKFLADALNYVLSQTHKRWECIIVDDGSEDNTPEIAAQFITKDNRFTYVYQENAGLSATRNTGLRNCKGKYIQFLDADDLILADKIKLQVQHLELNNEIDILYGDSVFFNTDKPTELLKGREKGQYNKIKSLKKSGKGNGMIKNITVNNFITVSSPLVKKELIDKVGFFDTSYHSYEDWQYWFRCAHEDAFFQYWPQDGTETCIRIGHTSMMTNSGKMVNAGIKIRKYMMPFLPLHLKIYNLYRLVKLFTRKALLN